MSAQRLYDAIDDEDKVSNFFDLLEKYGYSEDDITENNLMDIANIIESDIDITDILEKTKGYSLDYIVFIHNKDQYDVRISGESSLLQHVGEDSQIQCINSKCMSSSVTRQTAQMRSGDEGENIVFTCTDCGKRWVV